jgi:hypothetical protein
LGGGEFLGSHILSWGLFGVIEGVARKMFTFDNWNIKKIKFKESYCIVVSFLFAFIFLLAL